MLLSFIKRLFLFVTLICLFLLFPDIAFPKNQPPEKTPHPSIQPANKIQPAPLPAFRHVAGAIHLQTPVSGGKRNFNDYIALARQNDIGILIVTDRDAEKYQYGLWPLRGIFRKTAEAPSIFKYGIEKYFRAFRQADEMADNLIIIDGVESSPFYYWSGSYLKNNLTLNERGKHMLIIGLNDVNAYKNLPLIANGKSRFNQYEGPQGYAPYQDLIDYVNARNGLCFWAHPEANESQSINKINISTPPYPECVKATANYTGFGVFGEGYQKIGLPNGIWDEVLREYADGRRAQPCWAIGELDDYGDKDINRLLTVFLLKEKTYRAAVEALKTGKTYTVLKAADLPPLMLDDFCAYNTTQPNIAYSGDELVTSSTPSIRIKISFKTGAIAPGKTPKIKATLKVIRQGRIIKEINQTLPITLNFKDDYKFKPGERIYYRLEVTDEKNGRLISNPIFVRFQ